MTLSTERLKALAIEMAAAMPPVDPQDAAERRLLSTYRKLSDEGRKRADRYMHQRLNEQLGIPPEPLKESEIQALVGGITDSLREKLGRTVSPFLTEDLADIMREGQAKLSADALLARCARTYSGESRLRRSQDGGPATPSDPIDQQYSALIMTGTAASVPATRAAMCRWRRGRSLSQAKTPR